MKRLALIFLLALPLMAADRRRAVDPPEVPPDCSFMQGETPANITKANEWAKALGSKFLQCRGDLVRESYAYLANASLCWQTLPHWLGAGCTLPCPETDVLQWFWDHGYDFPRLSITHAFCVHRPADFIGRHAYVTTYFLGQPRELEVTDDSCAECEVWFDAPMIHVEPVWDWHVVPAPARLTRSASIAATPAEPRPLTPAQEEQIRIARERLANLLMVFGQ